VPPAYVSVYEYDPLRDEGVAYAARLLDAGIPVAKVNAMGLDLP
jgi:acetyl esterase